MTEITFFKFSQIKAFHVFLFYYHTYVTFMIVILSIFSLIFLCVCSKSSLEEQYLEKALFVTLGFRI